VVVEKHGGRFPTDEAALVALPGIGRYTAAAVAAIAYGVRTVPLDGNVERVVARLFAVEAELPAAKPELWRLAQTLATATRAGDFAQAFMDLGATICTPRQPACALCPWMDNCAARARGEPERFPLKARKREGRLRRGAAFVAVRADGSVLVRTRPLKGLLGGMTEVPTTEWTPDFNETTALEQAPHGSRAKRKWRRIPGVVTHVFTHFPLELVVYAADLPANTSTPNGMRWIALAGLPSEALPTVMRKVIAHALDSIGIRAKS
jgi:A/G-specific adenine glycosylase